MLMGMGTGHSWEHGLMFLLMCLNTNALATAAPIQLHIGLPTSGEGCCRGAYVCPLQYILDMGSHSAYRGGRSVGQVSYACVLCMQRRPTNCESSTSTATIITHAWLAESQPSSSSRTLVCLRASCAADYAIEKVVVVTGTLGSRLNALGGLLASRCRNFIQQLKLFVHASALSKSCPQQSEHGQWCIALYVGVQREVGQVITTTWPCCS